MVEMEFTSKRKISSDNLSLVKDGQTAAPAVATGTNSDQSNGIGIGIDKNNIMRSTTSINTNAPQNKQIIADSVNRAVNLVGRPQQPLNQQQQQLNQQRHPQINVKIASQQDVMNGPGGSGLVPLQQNHHLQQPTVAQNIHVQQQSSASNLTHEEDGIPVVCGKQGRVAVQKGRFSIMKDIPTEQSPSRSQSLKDHNPQQQQIAFPVPSVQNIPQHQHLNQQSVQVNVNLPSAPDQRNIHRLNSNGSTQTLDLETKIKGRFIVTKAADKGSMAQHLRSQSLGAQAQPQYQQIRNPNVPNLQINQQQQQLHLQQQQQQHQQRIPLAQGNQQTIHVNKIPVMPIQQSQQLTPNIQHSHRKGIQSAGSSPLVSHEYVQSVYTFPPPPIAATAAAPMTVNKPPIPPKASATIPGVVKGANVSSSNGMVPVGCTNKMIHYLDQMKLETIEASNMIQFLVSHSCIVCGTNFAIEDDR